MKFTGKERDAETGLDYFGARYFSGAQGRFTGPDPVGVMRQKISDPQQWNAYAYVRNNPLRLVDDNGKWPTEVHNKIIEKAFPGLTDKQLSTLKQTSWWMDHGVASQMKVSNHKHFMKSPGEDPKEAAAAARGFIKKEEDAAKKDQGGTPTNASDISRKSLIDFGEALHTVTDGTSPAHVDSNGNPRDWNGIPTSSSEVKAVDQHEAEEANPTPDQMANAVSAAQQAFRQTYGDAAYQQAIAPRKKPEQH